MTAVGPVTRRRFLRGMGGCGLIALGAGGPSGCAVTGVQAVPVAARVPDRSAADRTVRFANWEAYIDPSPSDPRQHPTLREFTRQTGIRVDYSEPIQSNEQFAGQLGLRLAMGEQTGFDLVVLTDWMAREFVQLGWAQPIRPEAIPNVRRRLLPALRQKPLFDVLEHSVPWQGSFTGIAWNANATRGRPVTSMSDLLTSADLHGRVGLVTEMRDVIGLILLELGYDPAHVTDSQFSAALRMVDQAFRSGQIRTVNDTYYLDLLAGKIAATVAWPGDITFYQSTHPELRFALPAAGWMVYTDNMLIPALSAHRENAERLMDFYYQPEVAALLTQSQEFLCPVSGTRQILRRTDPALSRQRYVFPPASLLTRAHSFRVLSTAQNEDYTSRYAATVGL